MKPANQPLERNGHVRHASCEARVTPAIAVAHGTLAKIMPISPWNSFATLDSPDGKFVAVFDQAAEIAMGAPTSGILKITEKKSKRCLAELSGANGSFVWASDSLALAFPRWTKRKMQQLVVLRLPEVKTEPQEGEFRVLELATFDNGVIEGVDSPIYQPAKLCITAKS